MASLYTSYATISDYETYTGDTVAPADIDSTILLILRASEIVNQLTYMNYDEDDEHHVEAVKLSVCAQVQYWNENGKGASSSAFFESVKIGSFNIKSGPGSASDSANVYTLCQTSVAYLERVLLLFRGRIKIR